MEHSQTYYTIKKILDDGNKRGAVTVHKLDVFLLKDRITEEEYNELVAMLNALNN